MKQFLHGLRPVLAKSLAFTAVFFAIGWLLGKLLDVEPVHQISRIAFFTSLIVLVIADPVMPIRWMLQTCDWLYHAKPLSPLLKDEREAVVWSLSVAEAASVTTYLLAKAYDSDALRFVATIAFLLFSTVIVILALPLLFRCFVRAIWWFSVGMFRLFQGIWSSLLLIWQFYRWLNFRRVIYLFLGFCALVLLAYAEEDLRGWWAWQRFKHEWEARGERFDYASVIPTRVPDEQNFALTPIVATTYE